MLKEKLIGECKACKGFGHIEDWADDMFGNTIRCDYECEECGGNGFDSYLLGEDDIVYVNVYLITRHYGGPEEGGWYYNWSECIEVIPVKNKNAEIMEEEAEKIYESKKHGNIYSVLGGRDIDVRIEATPKESETKRRPHYE